MSVLDNFRTYKGTYEKRVNESFTEMRRFLRKGPSRDILADSGYDDAGIKAVMKDSQTGENAFEKYDYTSANFKRRVASTVKGVKTARAMLQDVIPSSHIDAYFAFANSLIMRGGYNYAVDRLNQTSAAAAIWILDELTLEDKMDELFNILPGYDEENMPSDLIVPPLHHPIYDNYLIYSVIQMIQHRNTSKVIDKSIKGAINWMEDKPDKDDESQQNRRIFDQIISLIDPYAIKRATDKYESDVWEFYRLAFSAFYLLEERINQLENELEEIEGSLSNMLLQAKAVKANNVAVYTPNTSVSPLKSLFNDPERERLIGRRSEIEDEIDELYSITLTELSMANDREKVAQKLNDKGIISNELFEKLVSFHVDDPFETAFALLYLLDTKSPVPWYYYGSISVAYTMYDQFPFDAPMELPDKPILLSEFNDALYRHRFKGYRWDDRTDASGEPVARTNAKNLSQLLFSSSLTLFPRVISEQPGAETYLDSIGDLSESEKEAYSLLFHMLNAGKLRMGDFSSYRKLTRELEALKSEIEDIDVDYTEDIKKLKVENARLRQKNKELITSINSVLGEKKDTETQIRLLKKTNSSQNEELSDLRELVFILNSDSLAEEPLEESIEFPSKTSGKIVSFGGHTSWIKEIKKKLPDVVFISPEMQPNTEMIRNADTIWIQSNCIGHSEFYLIINTARNAGIPIRYYTYASAEKCAEQIVKSIKE